MKIFDCEELTFKHLNVAEKRITKTILKALIKCYEEKRTIDWKKLNDYVVEFFIIPICTAERLIESARERINDKELL